MEKTNCTNRSQTTAGDATKKLWPMTRKAGVSYTKYQNVKTVFIKLMQELLVKSENLVLG